MKVQINTARLVELRTDQKKKQKEVADYLDVHATQISKFETGAAQPSRSQVRDLARFFTVLPEYLLELPPPPPPPPAPVQGELGLVANTPPPFIFTRMCWEQTEALEQFASLEVHEKEVPEHLHGWLLQAGHAQLERQGKALVRDVVGNVYSIRPNKKHESA